MAERSGGPGVEAARPLLVAVEGAGLFIGTNKPSPSCEECLTVAFAT